MTDATFYDAGRVVSASCDTTIKIFNNYLRRCLGTLEGHKKAVTSIGKQNKTKEQKQIKQNKLILIFLLQSAAHKQMAGQSFHRLLMVK